jgi:hypothetical protein
MSMALRTSAVQTLTPRAIFVRRILPVGDLDRADIRSQHCRNRIVKVPGNLSDETLRMRQGAVLCERVLIR